jgi:hypothetical protein
MYPPGTRKRRQIRKYYQVDRNYNGGWRFEMKITTGKNYRERLTRVIDYIYLKADARLQTIRRLRNI